MEDFNDMHGQSDMGDNDRRADGPTDGEGRERREAESGRARERKVGWAGWLAGRPAGLYGLPAVVVIVLFWFAGWLASWAGWLVCLAGLAVQLAGFPWLSCGRVRLPADGWAG